MIWHAWHIEAFARQKKLPALKDLIAGDDDKVPRKRMTPEEIETMTRSWLSQRRKP